MRKTVKYQTHASGIEAAIGIARDLVDGLHNVTVDIKPAELRSWQDWPQGYVIEVDGTEEDY